MEKLTERERLITLMVAHGKSVKDIADKVCRSEHTITKQIQVIYDKTGIERRLNALAAYYYQLLISQHVEESLIDKVKNFTLNPNQPIYLA
ncbi:helix-turn-helix transcriptional regulator [Empedobacter brevis]|uniref:helix-turn-helix transcriptional regulator n=1 Tax=Empedobacter brevis TaxID=247 RepID=UPI00123D27A5|nr:helix-turn-helix transcriptional regulator [Empedobacter brevis]QES93118.1 helix-turn-helix transcriptional regulator [Empedobacter brevis]